MLVLLNVVETKAGDKREIIVTPMAFQAADIANVSPLMNDFERKYGGRSRITIGGVTATIIHVLESVEEVVAMVNDVERKGEIQQ